jgi:uncharacterized membrane protein
LVLVAYSVFSTAVSSLLGHGYVTAAVQALFVPGYLLLGILFPRDGEIPWRERLALSVVLTIIVVPILGLVLNVTPWGIGFGSLEAVIALLTLILGVVAYAVRIRLPPEERLSAAVELSLPRWKLYTPFDKLTTIGLLAGIVATALTLSIILNPPVSSHLYTSFYLLGPRGTASGYPKSLNVSEPGTVIVGIVNVEGIDARYTIRVDRVGLKLVNNATSGFNETIDVNRTTMSTLDVTLASGQNWSQPYTFRIDYGGLWKVQFFLFKNGDISSAYRELHLFIQVT